MSEAQGEEDAGVRCVAQMMMSEAPASHVSACEGRKMRPCSSVVEHSLGKGEVACSIHAMGTRIRL